MPSAFGPTVWIIAGLVLIGLEIVVPGVFLLWFGLAALVVGGIGFLFDLSLAGQLVTFAVLSAAAVYEGRRRLARADDTDDPTLNTGVARLIGTTHVLARPIENGRGRLNVGDGSWNVDGPDLPSGAPVRIVAVEGTRLRVEAVSE